jgi:hypothetical protein
MKTFNYLNKRWHNIEPEKNENMKKAGYVLITRPVSLSGIKKGKGQMVTAQSVKVDQLPESVKSIAVNIIKNY